MLRASAKRDNKLESSDALRRSNQRGAAYGSPRIFGLALVGGEGVLGVVALGDDLGGLRLALDGARESFLRGGVVVVLDLGVVRSVPVNEHADADEQIIGFLTGMMPSATKSATALATPACAGPNI